MADFSSNDINEAKRRVREMQQRAREYTNDTASEQNDLPINDVTPQQKGNIIGDIFGNLSSSNDSSLILAIILILSREKADNMLILALLYILL